MGQKGRTTHRWWLRGQRPPGLCDKRFASAYLFAAVEPATGAEVALVLPTISLVLLGSLWLWQHGYVLYWAIGTCIVVAGAYLLQSRLMVPLPEGAAQPLQDADPGDRGWTPRARGRVR